MDNADEAVLVTPKHFDKILIRLPVSSGDGLFARPYVGMPNRMSEKRESIQPPVGGLVVGHLAVQYVECIQWLSSRRQTLMDIGAPCETTHLRSSPSKSKHVWTTF
jgi:hypothetical protein